MLIKTGRTEKYHTSELFTPKHRNLWIFHSLTSLRWLELYFPDSRLKYYIGSILWMALSIIFLLSTCFYFILIKDFCQSSGRKWHYTFTMSYNRWLMIKRVLFSGPISQILTEYTFQYHQHFMIIYCHLLSKL